MTGNISVKPNEQNQEIERRFIVVTIPFDLAPFKNYKIIQGYEIYQYEAEDGFELRIRQKGDKFYETRKRGMGEIREEIEKELSEEEFKLRWPNTKDRVVEKTRYEIPSEAGLVEFDILHGKLTGLMVAEIEFENAKASKDFMPLDWFGREITEDSRFTNQSLIAFGLPEEILKTL